MKKILLALLVVVAVAAVGVLGSLLLFDGSPYGDSGDRDGADPDADGMFEDGALDPGDGDPERRRSAVLFGRASARVGKGDLLGRVAEFATKRPTAGALVRLEGRGHAGEAVASATETDPDGRFHLADVPAGEGYVLNVVVDEAVVRRLVEVAVSADDVADLGTIWLGDAGTLVGRVVSQEGPGIAGASVQVLPGGAFLEQIMEDIVGLLSQLDRDPAPLAQGKTDANGRFEIEGVPPGPIAVVVRAPGYYQQVRQLTMTAEGAIGDEPVFRLEPAEPITGRVVTDEGQGIAGARIAFMDSQNDDNGFQGRRFVETEEDGTFRIESPPSSSRLVAIVAADGYPTLFQEIKDQRDGLEFVLVGGASLTLHFVHDDSGEPIPDASIVAMLSDGPRMDDGGCFLTGATDAQGSVTFLAKPGFVGMLFFGHRTLGMGMYSPSQGGFLGTMALKGPDTLEVGAGENRAEFRKVPGIVVTGRVVDAEGAPIAAATVKAGGGMFGGGGKVVTDESGAYRLAVMAMPQTSISVDAPGFVQDPATMQVELDPPHPAEHDVVMLRAARIEGLVVGPKGAPVRGAEVRLRVKRDDREDETFRQIPVPTEGSAVTDRDGRYVFESVVPGRTYYVLAKGKGYIATPCEAPFEVRTGATVARAPRLVLETGLDIEIEVLDPSGQAVGGAKIDVRVEPERDVGWDGTGSWRVFQELESDASGLATATDVPPGKVTLFTKNHGEHAPARKSTVVARASPPTRPVQVRLRAATVVAGEVRDQHGAAVAGARVSASGASDRVRVPGQPDADENWVPHRSATTDASGRFQLAGIPAGAKITLSVYADGHGNKTFPLEGPTDRLQLEIVKIDPAVQKRLEAIQSEMMAIYQRMQAAGSDEEREALQTEISKLSEEMQRLRKGE